MARFPSIDNDGAFEAPEVRNHIKSLVKDNVQSIVATSIQGVSGDGETDNTEVLNEWFQNPGDIRRIVFPPGVFVGSLRVTSQDVMIEGQPGAVLKVPDNAVQGVTDAGIRVVADGVTVQNLTIDGNQRGNPHINTLADAAVSDGIGVYANNFTALNNHIFDPIGHGIIVWGTSHLDRPAGLRSGFLIHGNRIEGGSHRAVLDVAFNQGETGETKGIISNNRLTGNTFVMHSANDVAVTGNYCEGMSFHTECTNLTIVGNMNTGHPMNIFSGLNIVVANNISNTIDVKPGTGTLRPQNVSVTGNNLASRLLVEDSDEITLSQNRVRSIEVNGSTEITADGNTASGSITVGNTAAVTDARIVDNRASHLSIGSLNEATVQGNEMKGSSNHGLSLSGPAQGVLIKNNRVSDTNGVGVWVAAAATCENTIISGNHVERTTAQGILIAAQSVGAEVYDNTFHDIGTAEIANIPSDTILRNNGRSYGRIITPPGTLLATDPPAPVASTNFALFSRFTMDNGATVNGIRLLLGEGYTGTIRAGIVKFTSGTSFVKIAETELVEAPAAGAHNLTIPDAKLYHGDYAVFVWASTSGVSVVSAQSDIALAGRLASTMVNIPNGVPASGTVYENNWRRLLGGAFIETL